MTTCAPTAVLKRKRLELHLRMHFDHSKATKLVGERRPQNVRYEVVAGTIWTYFDAEREGLIEWRIDAIDDGQAKITKLTGDDVGYTTMYEVSKLDAKRWKPKDPNGLGTVVLWPCPDCGGDIPIRVGDYMCIQCRDLLDSGA